MLTFEITDADGVTRDVEIELTLDPGKMTLQESVKLEEALGSDKAAALFSGGEVAVTPSLIRTLVWVKLQAHVPGIALDGFDIPLATLTDIQTNGDASVIEMPMTGADGETETARVAIGTDSGNG